MIQERDTPDLLGFLIDHPVHVNGDEGYISCSKSDKEVCILTEKRNMFLRTRRPHHIP